MFNSLTGNIKNIEKKIKEIERKNCDMSSNDSKDKKLSASDEKMMMEKEEEEGGKVNMSFFDDTIDESENESMDKKKTEMPSSSSTPTHDGEDHEKPILTKTNNKSFMEIEVKRDKMRWLYMSELGAIFGEEKHTRDSFIKLFGTRVSFFSIKFFIQQKINQSTYAYKIIQRHT